jgi:hypothetical protein
LKMCVAMQSWVYRRGLSTHPWGAPVLRISVAEVLLSTLTTWGRPVRKSKTQMHREEFRPRSLILLTNLEGTMVLKAESCSRGTELSHRYSSCLCGIGQCVVPTRLRCLWICGCGMQIVVGLG